MKKKDIAIPEEMWKTVKEFLKLSRNPPKVKTTKTFLIIILKGFGELKLRRYQGKVHS